MNKKMKVSNFNVRIYGIVLNNKGQILIAREQYQDKILTKFIGGGLEKGEGLQDGLKREFMEELQTEIEVGDLFYINEFLQISYFKPEDQIISIYYYVHLLDKLDIRNHNIKHQPKQSLSWEDLNSFTIEKLSLPIDKVVMEKLKNKA